MGALQRYREWKMERKTDLTKLSISIFLAQLANVDDIRIDYMSDREKIEELQRQSINVAVSFFSKIDFIVNNADLYNTDAERVGETGESTDRPA